MKRFCFVAAVVTFVLAVPLVVICGGMSWPGAEAIRIGLSGTIGKEHTVPWRGFMCALDGDLMIVVSLDGGRIKSAPGDPPLPDYSLAFLLEEDQMFRARVDPIRDASDREKGISKKLLAKDGWYLTADFSTKPPQVILAEKPTKYSRWSFVNHRAPGEPVLLSKEGADVFIKNENAPGNAVWLSMEENGKTYRGGIARKPILSAEESDYFWIGPADEGK
jgi:hypothetical protein